MTTHSPHGLDQISTGVEPSQAVPQTPGAATLSTSHDPTPQYPTQGAWYPPQAPPYTAPGASHYPQTASHPPLAPSHHPIHPNVVKPPSFWPVVAVTLAFGVLGIALVLRLSRQAKALGASDGRYWKAFGGALAATLVVWPIVFAVINANTTVMTNTQLQTEIQSGDFGADVTPKDATCVEADVNANGAGTYRCLVEFDNGDRWSYTVTVGSDGGWVAGEGS